MRWQPPAAVWKVPRLTPTCHFVLSELSSSGQDVMVCGIHGRFFVWSFQCILFKTWLVNEVAFNVVEQHVIWKQECRVLMVPSGWHITSPEHNSVPVMCVCAKCLGSCAIQMSLFEDYSPNKKIVEPACLPWSFSQWAAQARSTVGNGTITIQVNFHNITQKKNKRSCKSRS